MLDDADRGGVHVRSEEAVETLGDEDHVRAILAGAEDPIDALRCGIVASDDFVRLRSEIELAACVVEAVSRMQRAEIDRRQSFAAN